MRKAYTLTSGIIAVAIYISIVGLLFWYFSYKSKEEDFTTKNEQIVAVDLSSMPSTKNKSNENSKLNQTKQEEKPLASELSIKQQKEITLPQEQVENNLKSKPKEIRVQKKAEPIPVEKPKEIVTKIKKQEIKKIQNDQLIQNKNNKPKNTGDLFANIKSDAPITPVSKPKPLASKQSTQTNTAKSTSNAASELINNEFGKNGNKGVEDAYKSRVKSILQGWPAQSSYAGERAKISFVIQPNGDFDFKIIKPSSNEEFNQGLVQYLKQLQKVGFGPHAGSRAYLFDVDFIAER
ncbi:MAG: TonB C-terminal domain-containing protein [Sulfurovaceae bacterium]|nr:TonB C-terminal domain-containing protein [Sulfurovaceae bacterium]